MPPPPLGRTARLTWLTPWGEWTARVRRSLDAIDTNPTAPELAALESCDGFAERVPRPPALFRDVAKRSTDVCAQLADAAKAARSEDAARLREAVSSGRRSLGRAYDALGPLLVENARLPHEGGLVEASRIEPTLSRAVASIAGARTEVRCWDDADWTYVHDERSAIYGLPDIYGSFADWGNIYLPDRDYCDDFARFIYGPGWTILPLDAAYDVVTLAEHAAYLAHPAASRAALACRAMQHIADVTVQLGGSQREARMLAAIYWREGYGAREAVFLSSRCRPNGPLDETPGDGVWP